MALLPAQQREQYLASLSDDEAASILYDWRWHARPNQILPGTPLADIQRSDWLFWLVQAGRGFGKTRVGAEAVKEWAEDPTERVLLVGPTTADVWETMINGPSGLMACYPPSRRPIYREAHHLIEFPSGAIGITRTAEEPERLRGPQFRKFWFDEAFAARYLQEAWDQLMFGFRLPSAKLQGIITSTPKPSKVIDAIRKHPRTVVTRGSSDDNTLNLSPEYIRTVIDPYRGTRLGRQEIEGDILDDVPGALWIRQIIDATRITLAQCRFDFLVRIVVAIDPAVSNNPNSDETGIIVAGLTNTHHVVIIEDLSLKGTPLDWAKVAIAAFRHRRADRIVGEVNNGGDLVARNIYACDPSIPFRAVRATRGKYLRAEPVAALYEQGRVHHVGVLRQLEDQLCGWTPQSDEKSPDRLDALVWAVTELLVDPETIDMRAMIGAPVEISRY